MVRLLIQWRNGPAEIVEWSDTDVWMKELYIAPDDWQIEFIEILSYIPERN